MRSSTSPRWCGERPTLVAGDVLICGLHGLDAIDLVANTGFMRSVVILGFTGVQALDLVGPFEVFTGASRYLQGMGREDYDAKVVTLDGEPATTGTGLALVAAPCRTRAHRSTPWSFPAVPEFRTPGTTST